MTSGAIITPSKHDRVRPFEVEIPSTRLGDQLAEHLTPGLQRFRVSGARCGQRQRAGFSKCVAMDSDGVEAFRQYLLLQPGPSGSRDPTWCLRGQLYH